MTLFFDYDLPPKLIAQEPASRRDGARLLVVNRADQSLSHRTVLDLPELLSPGDLVVLNDTKVVPARLIGTRKGTGGLWECLFVRERETGLWEVMARTRGFPQHHEWFVSDTGLSLKLVGRTAERHWLLRPEAAGSAFDLLGRYGHIPLPPYIRKGRSRGEDVERYQSVYASHPGSVAAPTAGLHFTPELFGELATKGIDTARVTLHVGLGTFAPVTATDPLKHEIHGEWCEVSEWTAATIATAKRDGRRVIAVGTTTTRTLETAGLNAFGGESKLFIHPPYEFKILDGLLTNFHLPRTTLLLLVQAFAGSDLLRQAYDEAIRNEYRFFSYGDAMLIL